jgi:hypothetical protein
MWCSVSRGSSRGIFIPLAVGRVAYHIYMRCTGYTADDDCSA